MTVRYCCLTSPGFTEIEGSFRTYHSGNGQLDQVAIYEADEPIGNDQSFNEAGALISDGIAMWSMASTQESAMACSVVFRGDGVAR